MSTLEFYLLALSKRVERGELSPRQTIDKLQPIWVYSDPDMSFEEKENQLKASQVYAEMNQWFGQRQREGWKP